MARKHRQKLRVTEINRVEYTPWGWMRYFLWQQTERRAGRAPISLSARWIFQWRILLADLRRFWVIPVLLLMPLVLADKNMLLVLGTIAVDTTATGFNGSPGTTINWNHTCSGSNRGLVILAGWNNASISSRSVTYNGAALTQADAFGTSGTYYLINPASGTNSCVISWTTSARCAAGSISFSDCDQSTMIGNSASNSGSGTTDTLSLTLSAADSIAVENYNATGGNPSLSANDGQTQIQQRVLLAPNARTSCWYKVFSSPGSVNLGITGTVSTAFEHFALEILNVPTGLDLPTVSTDAATSVAKRDADLNGDITDVGVGSCISRGFVYDVVTHADPGNVAPGSTDYALYTDEAGTFSTGAYDLPIASLNPDTVYYVRAFAENADGFAYGDEVTFETLPVFYNITGVATLAGVPVENAVVRCIRQSDNEALPDVLTDSSGVYVFEDLEADELYHVAVEYEADDQKYNALSLWDVAPYELP